MNSTCCLLQHIVTLCCNAYTCIFTQTSTIGWEDIKNPCKITAILLRAEYCSLRGKWLHGNSTKLFETWIWIGPYKLSKNLDKFNKIRKKYGGPISWYISLMILFGCNFNYYCSLICTYYIWANFHRPIYHRYSFPYLHSFSYCL
jgi:hypothetical protein